MWADFVSMNKLPEFFDPKNLLIDICDMIVHALLSNFYFKRATFYSKNLLLV